MWGGHQRHRAMTHNPPVCQSLYATRHLLELSYGGAESPESGAIPPPRYGAKVGGGVIVFAGSFPLSFVRPLVLLNGKKELITISYEGSPFPPSSQATLSVFQPASTPEPRTPGSDKAPMEPEPAKLC
jgi:hypothetical protein